MSETVGKVANILAYPFSRMEIFNRKSAALAAFRTFREQRLDYNAAIAKARDLIYETHI